MSDVFPTIKAAVAQAASVLYDRYNTLVFINRRGELLGRHRQIMPMHAERVHWGMGDGSNIRTWNYDRYRLSGLLCWEHSMDLMRHTMIAQRPQIHVASWVGGGAMTNLTTTQLQSMAINDNGQVNIAEPYLAHECINGVFS